MLNKWNKKTMTYIHDTNDEITITEILSIIIKRKFLFISTLILSFILISTYLIKKPKEYEFHQYIKPTSENVASAGNSAAILKQILKKTFTKPQVEIKNQIIKITITTAKNTKIKSIVDNSIKEIKKRYANIIILKKNKNLNAIKTCETKINNYKSDIDLNVEKLKANTLSINNSVKQIKLIDSFLKSSTDNHQINLWRGNKKILNSTLHSTIIENKMLSIKNKQNSEDITIVQTTIDNLNKTNSSYANIKVLSELKQNKNHEKTTLKNVILLLFSPLISFILIFSIEYYTNSRFP